VSAIRRCIDGEAATIRLSSEGVCRSYRRDGVYARTFDFLPEIEASCRRVYRLGLGLSCTRLTDHLLVGAKEKIHLLEHWLLRRG
jgi:hypothetical protein